MSGPNNPDPKVRHRDSITNRSTVLSVFQNLAGPWHLTRKIASLSAHPSGTFTGTAHYYPRPPSDPSYDAEYLYEESGHFIADGGMGRGLSMKASRRYVWRYQRREEDGGKEGLHEVSVWFVGEGRGMREISVPLSAEEELGDVMRRIETAGLFHVIKFRGKDGHACYDNGQGDSEGPISRSRKADGHHLCEKDNYDVRYNFVFQPHDHELEQTREWQVRYKVTGPEKNYVLENMYTRQEKTETSNNEN